MKKTLPSPWPGRAEVVETVFHRKGEPISQNSIRNVFKRVLRKAGLRNIRFHEIRHSFASLLLSNGESPVYVNEQMGHSSIKITVDVYGHLIPSSNREAVNRLDTHQEPAPYTHPSENEKAVINEDYGLISKMVPKGRLELPQAYAY